jgi:hypothetical protein
MVVEGVRTGADPAEVATAIVAAASDPTSPVHVPVGSDAVAAIAHYEAHGLAGFDDAARAVFGDDVPVP